MSRKTRKLKNKLPVPFEWIGIALALCVIPWSAAHICHLTAFSFVP